MGPPKRSSFGIGNLSLIGLHAYSSLSDLHSLTGAQHGVLTKAVDEAFDKKQGSMAVRVG